MAHASDLADRAVAEGASKRVVERAGVARTLGSNVAYATLVTAFAAVVLVVAAQMVDNKGALPMGWSVAVIGILTHVVITFLMVLKRAYRLLQAQLDVAATGDG